MMPELLGLPQEQASAIAQEHGYTVRIERTCPPRPLLAPDGSRVLRAVPKGSVLTLTVCDIKAGV